MSLYARPMDDVVRRLDKVERQLSTRSGLQNSSLEGGSIAVNDAEGKPVASVGMQEDGSGATRFFDGPVPPVPSGFTALADGPLIQGTWDGTFKDGAQATYDLAYLEFATTLVEDSGRVSFATITAKEGASATVVADTTGLWAVAVRSVSQAGKKSEFASAGTVEVKLTDVAGAIEAVQDSANGKNKITWSLRVPTPEDPGTVGDTWWVNEARTREDGTAYLAIIAQYQYQSGGWVQVEMAHEVIASIDLGTATVGELNGIRIMAQTIGTEQLRADFADFVVARSGTYIAGDNRSIMNDAGYTIFNDAGDVRTKIGPDDSVFKGEVEAETLVVNEGAEFRSAQNILAQGAKLTLAAGVTDPTAPPVVQPFWDSLEFEKPTSLTNFVGLAWDGVHYWTVSTNSTFFDGADPGIPFQAIRVDPTTSAVKSFAVPASSRTEFFGVTCIGSELFWLYRAGYSHKVLVTDLDCVKLREFPFEDAGHGYNNPLTYKPGIGNDGTNPVIAHCSDSGNLYIRTYDKTTGAKIDTITAEDSPASDFTGVYVGAGDFGGTHVVCARASNDSFIRYTMAGARVPNGGWFAAGNGHVGIVFHDGQFHSLNPSGEIVTYADNNTGDSETDWWAAYYWYTDVDDDGVIRGNDYMSLISPPKRFTWPRRAMLRVIGQPLPDGAESVGPCLAKKSTTPVRTDFHGPGWYPVEGTSKSEYRALPTDWETKPEPRDTNTFPNAEKAVIESASATFRVEGDGAGRWGPLTFNTDGTVVGLLKHTAGRTILETTSSNETVAAFVTFPAGRFTERPSVTATADSVTPGTGLIEVSAAGPTKDGFTLYMRRATVAPTGITWIAMEMG